jgi:hypothetical protein
MSTDAGKPFDPTSGFSDLTSYWMSLLHPYRSFLPNVSGRYEMVDPKVQEVAILAAMHNMASLLSHPEKVKAVLSAELAERAARLAEGG